MASNPEKGQASSWTAATTAGWGADEDKEGEEVRKGEGKVTKEEDLTKVQEVLFQNPMTEVTILS